MVKFSGETYEDPGCGCFIFLFAILFVVGMVGVTIESCNKAIKEWMNPQESHQSLTNEATFDHGLKKWTWKCPWCDGDHWSSIDPRGMYKCGDCRLKYAIDSDFVIIKIQDDDDDACFKYGLYQMEDY